ncbi:MAG: hypothetical protein HW402_1180 [Dehalococcoidales bacterium]|nr:hypothetical protein [Dehalococcoidales bacterium]
MEGRVKEKKIEYYTQLPYSILLHQVEDEGKKYWIAEVPELPGCKSHGSTVEEAVESVEEAKKDWIEDSLEKGEDVPVPVERESYSGRILVRMSRSLHRALSLMAESEKLSLNQLIVTILAKEVGRLDILNRVEDKIDRLLDKVNDALEKEERQTFSKSFRIIAEHSEQGQYLPAGTAHTLEAPVVTNLGVFKPGVASTASQFEESWFPNILYPKWQSIIYGAGRDKEAIESKK